MHLGVYTNATFILFLILKLTGVAGAVTWGWIAAPVFFHLGAVTFMVRLKIRNRQFAEQLKRILDEQQ